ncbi:DUF642 domain-containing protein [Candidatus Nitrosacidococcus sp. I8]|uniref:DUF642 domain-containing protein n=1 Tax=Candidatus Nitrosacidococcus sp. I8 TaxID=2942908 RepID=UPI00222705CB|nr:DUF642 domain-containing protein [Candidatus Nitrosacidococcus sp. I8]CAH9017875.1 hypothetical protein NURINAE_00602 [Candidatus Nitrosacidococcus sp. I8]
MKVTKISAALALSTAFTINAHAAPLVSNGDFSQSTYSTASQVGDSGTTSYGQGLAGWTATGYTIWYPSVQDSIDGPVANQFTNDTGTSPDNAQNLHSTMTGTDANGTSMNIGAFVGLDGDQTQDQDFSNGNTVQASISQTINGLTAGQNYTVSFDWGAAQLQGRTGKTTEQLQVSLGNVPLSPSGTLPSGAQSTAVLDNSSGGFTGWQSQSFTFTAQGASQVLSFLSVGTPGGLPPMAVLANVAMVADVTPPNNVPEPAAIILFGTGLFGLAFFMRRYSANLL